MHITDIGIKPSAIAKFGFEVAVVGYRNNDRYNNIIICFYCGNCDGIPSSNEYIYIFNELFIVNIAQK